MIEPDDIIGTMRPFIEKEDIGEDHIWCEGQSMCKKTFKELYDVMGGKFGETEDKFYIPYMVEKGYPHYSLKITMKLSKENK